MSKKDNTPNDRDELPPEVDELLRRADEDRRKRTEEYLDPIDLRPAQEDQLDTKRRSVQETNKL